MSREVERVLFRLLRTRCCGAMLCWVNPRLPTFCPECGQLCFGPEKTDVLKRDDSAILEVNFT